MKIYKKLFSNENKDNFFNMMEEIIQKKEIRKQEYYRRNIKYTTKDYIMGIIEVLSNNISWRKYNGKIDGRILNNKHNYYIKLDVYKNLYKSIKEKYLDRTKMKYLSIDSRRDVGNPHPPTCRSADKVHLFKINMEQKKLVEIFIIVTNKE